MDLIKILMMWCHAVHGLIISIIIDRDRKMENEHRWNESEIEWNEKGAIISEP